jgi:hypothetical protein
VVGFILLVVVPILLLILEIALLVWVARDAKARGMDSAVLWMLLVFFTSLFGLVIYLLARPQGSLIRCENCGNSRLKASRQCPHCGNRQDDEDDRPRRRGDGEDRPRRRPRDDY